MVGNRIATGLQRPIGVLRNCIATGSQRDRPPALRRSAASGTITAVGFLDRVAKAFVPAVDKRPGGELGGVPARAVVVEKRAYGTPEKGVSTRYVNLDLVLRVVGDDEGQTTKVRAYVAPRAAVIATAGLEVPVRVDESGALLGLDGEAWEAEAKVLDAEYEAGTRTRGDRRTAADVLTIDPADPVLAPIAGVDLDTWLAIEVGLVADGVPPREQEAYAVARGIPAGSWAAVSKGWTTRARKDFRVGTKLGAAHQAAADARG